MSIEEYLDAGKHPWLHLVDGGITDNLGLRAFYSIFALEGDPGTVFREFGHENVRKVLIIAVNAAVQKERNWSSQAEQLPAAAVMAGATDRV